MISPPVAKLVDAQVSGTCAHWACRFDPGLGDHFIRGYSSAGRAPALQAGCRRFNSGYLHHPYAQLAERSKASDCKPDRFLSRQFESGTAFH